MREEIKNLGWLPENSLTDEELKEWHALEKKLLKKEENLPKEEAIKMARRIRPILRLTEDQMHVGIMLNGRRHSRRYWVKSRNIYDQCFSYKAEPYAAVYGLKEVTTIETWHKSPNSSLLRPSVYEVLYQIPEDLRDKVVAFELYSEKASICELWSSVLRRHRLKCVLYTGKMPKEVQKKRIYWAKRRRRKTPT